MKLWIDTDIGGDIDDALAILLALSHPEAEILGVSTVFGNTRARARIARTLLLLGGRDVPVYAGAELPERARRVFHDDVDPNSLPPTYLKAFDGAEVGTGAAEALARALRENDDVRVVTLGALTNIAKLLREYPREAEKIGLLCIMGAASEWNVNEFNVTCDPEAADRVFSSKIPKKLVTLDVTFRCALSEAQIARLSACGSECVRTVLRMSRLWAGGMVLHDPLALVAALCDRFLTFRPGDLKVELAGEYSRGKCVNLCDFNWGFPPRRDMLVSESVQSEAFTAYYVEKICELDRALQSKENKEEIV